MTEEQVQKLIQLHLSDMPLTGIAEEFGVSLVTIKRRIAEIRQTHHLPYRSKSTQKTRIDRAENDIDSTAWNVRLGVEYIKKQWVGL